MRRPLLGPSLGSLVVSSIGVLALASCVRSSADASVPPPIVAAIPPLAAASSIGAEPSSTRPCATATCEAPTVLLRDARLIDGTGAAPREHVDVLVERGRIAQIGPGLPPPQGAQVIELHGRTLLPGLIDAHVHLSASPPASYAQGVVDDLGRTLADHALLGASNARATLLAGFTTVRNVGGSLADRALRDAIANGLVPGPRMLVANHAIGITGGHCDDTNAMHPDVMPQAQDYRHGVADGPEEVRKAVRYQIKHGADVIKVCATGGVMSQGDAVGAAQLDPQELRAAVDAANRAERKVAAHAHGNQGIREAVEAGVHSIEHGSILDEPSVRMMVERGTFLVPTVYVAKAVERQADAGKLSEDSARKAREIAPKMRRSFRLAYEGGVKIALGSDAGVFAHGDNGKELTTMVELGMTPMDAIVAGTSRAAELLGLRDVGRVEEGLHADLVVVEGDPLANIEVLERPAMVMKGGVIYLEPAWD
ncbi:metal-dependent hydrolase family protein [Paraliomyxa miuraensis]|uniref:metal-dependent hydrolase family protein n=1 Tax=Paraliomyxa miuraensis TaxID=376150 RepID=UPI00224F184D|nr:amidohydrolase family protein [Paraliomyxa miuraensis]MCX4244353.1 amidohydrolase family protein [Paraliomyxa miuraensis]